MRHFIPSLFSAILLSSSGVFGAVTKIAGAAVTLTDEKVIANLGGNADILEDSSGALNINQITMPGYAARFRPSRETVPNLGYTRAAVWVRFRVKNLTFS